MNRARAACYDLRMSFLLALLLSLHANAAPPASRLAQALRLHVVSYNIKGLPSLIMTGDYQDARYGVIGRLLGRKQAGPEIVALQEAFSERTKELLDAANFPYLAAGPTASSFLGVSSGIYILSRYPILEQAARAFGGELCLSWDCLSNKGVQFARIAVPGLPRPLDLFNTHLQSGYADTPTRRRQVEILLEFFRQHHQPDNPVIFAGDFNFRPGLAQPSFFDFAKGSGLLHAGKFCLERGCANGNDEGWRGIWNRTVDHQFFSARGGVRITPLLVERSYGEDVDGLKLSDHPAHEVRYELRWDGSPFAAERRAPSSFHSK